MIKFIHGDGYIQINEDSISNIGVNVYGGANNIEAKEPYKVVCITMFFDNKVCHFSYEVLAHMFDSVEENFISELKKDLLLFIQRQKDSELVSSVFDVDVFFEKKLDEYIKLQMFYASKKEIVISDGPEVENLCSSEDDIFWGENYCDCDECDCCDECDMDDLEDCICPDCEEDLELKKIQEDLRPYIKEAIARIRKQDKK